MIRSGICSQFGTVSMIFSNDDKKHDKVKNNLSLSLKDARKNFEHSYLEEQLKRFKGNIAKTSTFIGMDRSALHRKLKELNIKRFHYVAPSVWAWRPNRAKIISNYIDHVLALFPFEPPYFNNVGLSCDFVGHPIVSEDTAAKENIIELKKQYSLGDDPVILCLPGSRKSEINRLMPTFGKTLERFSNVLPNSRFILCSTPNVFEHSKNYLKSMPKKTIFLSPEEIGMEKYLAFKKASFKISDLALAASGTVSLELAANGTPMVIGYDMNYFSRQIIQMLMLTDTVNLVNLITGNRNIPECIGANFNSENLFLEMVRVYSNNQNQVRDFATTMVLLGENDQPPNVRAANSIIRFYKEFKTVR